MGDTEENSGAQTEGAADLTGVLRELESRGRLPGFFSSWSFRDTVSVSVPALVIDWGTLELLRLWFLGVPFAGLALLLALVLKVVILLSLAEDLSAAWRARQLRFALAVHRRREALRAVLISAPPKSDT